MKDSELASLVADRVIQRVRDEGMLFVTEKTCLARYKIAIWAFRLSILSLAAQGIIKLAGL